VVGLSREVLFFSVRAGHCLCWVRITRSGVYGIQKRLWRLYSIPESFSWATACGRRHSPVVHVRNAASR
jgi:hypothetical protein